MAIFVALIFQILFVLFSMSINIALMVHDKINLQNAVDLAAYYVAQRQAEILNIIAHQNYQIRQAWKLLSWRYRVLGTLGLENHPVRTFRNLTESKYIPVGSSSSVPEGAICMIHRYNEDARDSDGVSSNLCKAMRHRIPALPQITVVFPIPINFALQAFRNQLARRYSNQCDDLGAQNWWFALNIFVAYRYEQAQRKELIRLLAKNLKGDPATGDFKDIRGESVLEGATKVFQKNLSFSNAQAFKASEEQKIELFNSFQNVSRSQWLPEILISPTLLYVNPKNGSECAGDVSMISNRPHRTNAVGFSNASQLHQMAKGEPRPGHLLHMSLGVEKNPWYMSYVGIKAKTKPRQLFWPIGPSLTLTARAFAKPFGGRIGPWYGKLWAQGSPLSTGSNVDRLLPPRITSSGVGYNENSLRRFPNYSRFPGDLLGLHSRLALVSAVPPRLWNLLRFRLDYYFEISRYPSYDSLAWDRRLSPTGRAYRNYEISALSPDLFDATYYSIALRGDLYYNTLLRNRRKLGIPPRLFIKPDLGAHPPSQPHYNIKKQMKAVNAHPFQRHPQAHWFITHSEHLLTSWTSGYSAIDYEFPSNRFGKCGLFDNNLPVRLPQSSCVAMGGRSGYSVKLISRNALLSSSHNLGGGSGAILNPPPADF